MADADEQQITLPDVKILRFFGGAEVFDRDAVARLEPWQSAQSGDVEAHRRPTIPSRITSIESEVAPVGVMTRLDVVVELRVENAWHNASMWLVAFPWTFIVKRSIAKSSPRVRW